MVTAARRSLSNPIVLAGFLLTGRGKFSSTPPPPVFLGVIPICFHCIGLDTCLSLDAGTHVLPRGTYRSEWYRMLSCVHSLLFFIKTGKTRYFKSREKPHYHLIDLSSHADFNGERKVVGTALGKRSVV